MESYLVDEAVLGEIAKALIKEKYPNDSVESHAEEIKEIYKKLDHQITKAIIGELTPEQGQELTNILKKDASMEEIDEFFQKYHIDLNEVVKNAMVDFKEKFLKGDKNA